jgi:hypothetical protein
MTDTEALDVINSISFAYHDQFDPNLPKEDREWNRIQFEELRDKVVHLLSHPSYDKEGNVHVWSRIQLNRKTAASESLGDTLTAVDPTQPTSNTTREEVL